MLELFKKTCSGSRQIMSYELFKEALIRVARMHVNTDLLQANEDLREVNKSEMDKQISRLHSIKEVEEDETPMPKIEQ